MDPATTNTVIAIGGYVFTAVVGILAWSLQRNVSKVDRSIDSLDRRQNEDAKNLEEWKMIYLRGHGEVEGKIAVLQSTCDEGVRQLQIDSRTMMIAQATTAGELAALRRAVQAFDRRGREQRDRDES